jgi:hypothetical protein
MFTIKGDGLVSGKMDPKLRLMLTTKVQELNTQYDKWAPRAYEAERMCTWAGQSRDGLKHDVDKEIARPFDGAPDVRVRLADKIINETNLMFLLAAMRAQIYVVGPGSGVQRGKKLMALAEWLKSTLWGRSYARAILELGNYVLGDSPGVGLMMVPWREIKGLRLEEIGTEEAAQIFAAGFAAQFANAMPDAVAADVASAGETARQEFLAVLGGVDEEAIRGLAERMAEILTFMRPARARKVLADLRRTGTAKFPRPYDEFVGPSLEACRFGEDFVFEDGARDFHELDVWFQGRWLTESQARALALEEGWSRTFQEKLLGDGEPGEDGGSLKGKEALRFCNDPADEHKEHYQVLRAWVRLTNEDGVPGRYWITFHPDIEEPATGLRNSEYPTGGWPGVWFENEVLGKRILASRGVTELVVGDQALVKKLLDTFGANAILNGVPPIVSSGRKDRGQLALASMREIELKANGKLEWLKGPSFAMQTPEMLDRIQAGIDEQFGRPSKTVPDTLTGPVRQGKIMWLLVQLAEVWKLALMECQAWMPDETLQMVTGKDGASLIKGTDDIRGPFSLALRFDPDDLNLELLQKKAEMLKNIIGPMDREGVISWSEAVAHLVGAVFPQLEFVRPQDQAKTDEIADEQEQFVRMLAGIEDKRPTDGSISYGVRAEWLQGHLEAHPELAERMDEKSKFMLLDRLEFLRAQEQQFGANAEIGREGAERKAEGENGAMMAQ